ncbi:hypothetical protein BANRA_05761 [Pseudomonas aeruginosa]|nr:hypothetical protein BANRA_05761 [Pseudomonas aeruginosa]
MATEQTLDQRYQAIRANYSDYIEHTRLIAITISSKPG